MFDGLIAFGHSLGSFLTLEAILYVLASTLVGVIIGALPGLTATMGVALMTTLTIKMPSNQALLVLICTYVGAIYGGSRSAILLNIPGTPASAAACLDGYALARQGMAGRAMGIATTGSVLGTLIGMFFLALFTPLLGDLALKFGAYEFFWLAVFGVIVSATLTGGDPLKGWIAGFAGLFIATIGQDGIHAFERFSFGNRDLAGGFSLVPALVGAFGFAEILVSMQERRPPVKLNPLDTVMPKLRDIWDHRRTILRSGVIGVSPACCPAWARTPAPGCPTPRPRRQQGEGRVRQGLDRRPDGRRDRRHGVDSRPHHPCLALGIPGSAPSAVLMAAMIIHGIQPGPMLMISTRTSSTTWWR
jgi:putative tricarboxylic transport membrane protein